MMISPAKHMMTGAGKSFFHNLLKGKNYIFLGANVKPLLLSTETDGKFSIFEFTEVKGHIIPISWTTPLFLSYLIVNMFL